MSVGVLLKGCLFPKCTAHRMLLDGAAAQERPRRHADLQVLQRVAHRRVAEADHVADQEKHLRTARVARSR